MSDSRLKVLGRGTAPDLLRQQRPVQGACCYDRDVSSLSNVCWEPQTVTSPVATEPQTLKESTAFEGIRPMDTDWLPHTWV